jgi:predicted permease
MTSTSKPQQCGHVTLHIVTFRAAVQANGDRSTVLSRAMLLQPAIWVTLASLAIRCCGGAMPPSVLTAADTLSILHGPLAFLAIGMSIGKPKTIGSGPHLAIRHTSALLASAAMLLAGGPAIATAALLTSVGENPDSRHVCICTVLLPDSCGCMCIRTGGARDHANHAPPACGPARV